MLTAIAEARAVISRATLLPQQELRLRRHALARMTHASTQIEGNILNIHQVEALLGNQKVDAPMRDIYEVENYIQALNYITSVVEKKLPITDAVVLKIHRLVTENTLPAEKSGHYRSGPVYVVKRGVGIPNEVIYTGPTAEEVAGLMRDLILWIQRSEKNEISPIIVAGVVHQEIAAIHPFSDGNGRTARALATLILYQRGYDFRRLFALEDHYNQARNDYYQAIAIGKTYAERAVDFTPWLEYFIKGFKEEIDVVKNQVIALAARKVDELKPDEQVYLNKEQMSILDFLDQMGKITIKDAVDILGMPKRTVQLYLQQLKKLRMIEQVGKGPSSAYVSAK